MDLKLNNKVALVLAASKGLGKAIATALSAEGAKVIIGSRDEAELNKTAGEIRKLTGNEVVVIPVDVSSADEIDAFVAKAAATFGRIDILLNNAGGPPFDKFENFDDEQWQKAFELNLLSVARFSKLVLPHMQKTGSGRIINIISGSVKAVLGNSVLSTTMRMGVVGMAKLMADEFGPYNITVNNVAPGLILTDRIKHTLPKDVDPEQAIKDKAKAIPLGRIGKPEELAALVAFLASEQAAYISGTTIQVDGGANRAIF
ncbi:MULTISPECIES: SDR family oxidoreductase [unclassified Mucilaginibacter]|jgi:3-oxoacyl-[acyl-carrier protein] reductase|uniref:SDR family oxidoreductase n=1 Tax=unclassified Mucilaginibacter TaxID=2617802 RepID=UPI0008B36CF3|nr:MULTISPECIES: SDR family oxidoreductase [unclassified Mucilaginibacter]WDF77759.1 SDR family oxidoreductase [Mucilaginibacter sp. KACC 22773]SEP27071.1 3-oxoacyl-[acyl-carrier protein] reductase [Mucilaginibacter sp. OK283]